MIVQAPYRNYTLSALSFPHFTWTINSISVRKFLSETHASSSTDLEKNQALDAPSERAFHPLQPLFL